MNSEKSNLEHKQAIYERRNKEIENEINRLIEEKRANNNAIANIDAELQQDYDYGGVYQW